MTQGSLVIPKCVFDNLAHSEDAEEKTHNAAFHQVLHCSLRQSDLHREEIQYFVVNNNMGPLDMHNVPSQIYCIKPDGKIHKYIKY